jgi:hypothetical protein
VGEDRVLISAYMDNTGANDAGAAYLFDTNGTLLLSLTNPAPATLDSFGYSVAASREVLLIGAPDDDAGAKDAGSAYVFSTDGPLLATIKNPTPAIGENFGRSVAILESGVLVIGVPGDGAGAYGAGVVCLYAPPPPRLAVAGATTGTISLSWPASATGWLPQVTSDLGVPGSLWTNIPPPYETNANRVIATFTNNPAIQCQFFRLYKP